MVYLQTSIRPGKSDAKNSQGFWDTNKSPNPEQKTRPSDNNKKKPYRMVNYVVLSNHRVKIKENEKRNKYLDFVRELRKLRNITVTVIGALLMLPKSLIKGLKVFEICGQAESIQTTASLRSARILRKVLETWGKTCCPSDSKWKNIS